MGLKVTVAWPSSESLYRAAFFRFLRKSCKKQLLIVYKFPFILHLALAIRTKPNPSPTWVSYVFRCFQLSTGSFNCTRVFLSDLSRFEFGFKVLILSVCNQKKVRILETPWKGNNPTFEGSQGSLFFCRSILSSVRHYANNTGNSVSLPGNGGRAKTRAKLSY